jgi:FAD/FMN-containing dehydrogenase/Fe-S oxidoreductase
VGGVADLADTRSLADELRLHIAGEVRFDAGTRAIYSTDSSNYRQLPIGVVVPRTVDDVVEAVAVCRRAGVPVLSRGSGTSLAGQCCNVAVVIDHSKYLNRVLEIDRDRRLARVQAGVILDDLRNRAEGGEPRLTFGPDPSTHDHCTIGGMLGNNSCGTHSVMSEFYGPGPRMSHNVEHMDVLTYDGLRLRVGRTPDRELEALIAGGGRQGEIYRGLRDLRDRYAELIRTRYPDIPRRVSGYNLDELLPENGFNVAASLVGTEGTCVTVLEAAVRLIDSPPARSVVIAGFEDVYRAADAVMLVREHQPIGIEGFDEVLVEDNKKLGIHNKELEMLPEGRGWLLIEFGGATTDEADDKANHLMDELKAFPGLTDQRLYDDPEEEKRIWEVRESGLGATAFVPGSPDTFEGWEDSGVPPDRLADYLRDLRGLFNKYGFGCALYGHFGQGCVHTRIDFDLFTVEGLATYRSFVDEASDLVLSLGGSLSGEHGDGQSRGELLSKMYGGELVQAFREFKGIWDPEGRMNPGKVVDPDRMTENLKFGTTYNPPHVQTHFSYPADHGSFAHAATRCVGIGKCRRTNGGTMCPSFMATREEEHTTRGRARILFEMMNSPDIELWRSDEVKDALELCLSCKGCKGDCPVNVDMATYKAEFLSHYYEGRVRPRQAYALGLIHWWARAASRAPRLANAVTHAPVSGSLLKRAAGIAPQREAPRFAGDTFVRWFRRREQPTQPATSGTVLLWPDTFTNHFHPDVARAAVEVLERAGCRVAIPNRPLCCGRPLYDYGMLDLAKRQLRRILKALRRHIRAGIPVVGLEPSCLAVFRDELPELFPHDEDAWRLKEQSFLLSEFLTERVHGWDPPRLDRKAIVQGHCHQRAVVGMDADQRVMQKLGLDVEVLDSGCCGLAGSFGFEKGEKYRVAQLAGERVLFPRVRGAGPDTLLIADGFSCRTQIEHGTRRRALHLAQVIQMASKTRVPGRP